MDLYTTLQQSGLNERETHVYLALLELGESSVLQVGLKSGIERTYCYDILESLVKKGLASAVQKNNRRRYLPGEPETMEKNLEKQLATLRQALPELRALHNTGGQKPTVRFFEGKGNIANLYQELIEAKQYDAIVSPSALYQVMGKQINDFARQVVKRGTRARELVTAEIGMPEYASILKPPLQEVRLLPAEVKLTTDTLIYENKVISIAYHPTLHAVVTEGSEIVSTQKALFDFMWNESKKYR